MPPRHPSHPRRDHRLGGRTAPPLRRRVPPSLPTTVRLALPGHGTVLCCHATPRDDEEVVLVDSRPERWAEVLADLDREDGTDGDEKADGPDGDVGMSGMSGMSGCQGRQGCRGRRTVVCGHTHVPSVRLTHGRLVVTPGGVGMPYGRPGAHWALLTRTAG